MQINKSLYGDGSRNARLRCEVISCDKANKCSLYKEGKCMSVTAPFSSHCKIGSVSRIDGGTKQSKKFYILKEEVHADELYNKLSHPYNCYIYKVDDTIVLMPSFVMIKENENGTYTFDTPMFGSSYPFYMPIEKFTYEFLDRLCSFIPRSWGGGQIEKYHTDVIPFMLKQLKNIMPEYYAGFIKEYPKHDVTPNYIGKYAYMNTVNQDPSCIYTDCHGNKFHFEDGYLIGTSSALMPFSAKNVELKITVTNDMKYKIDDNKQVLETTRFE